VQSLRSFVREAEPDALRRDLGGGASEVAQILPELRAVLPGLPEPAPLESGSARFRLFDATAEFLRNASRNRPLLLFLDDLHAADAPSLLLLQFLARELASMRILVLGACRDVDPIPGQDLAAMLTEVAREPVTTRLQLAGLSERDVAQYVELTAAELASPQLIASLHEQTEGNPLFVGETVRLLAVEGRVAIPQSVRDVIARRLGHLSDECNRLLVLASVLGREFALDALARVGSSSEETLLDILDEAMVARVLSDVPGSPGRLRFAHVLIRDTLYEGLTTARRVKLHRIVVEALEALYGEGSGPHLSELAYHAIAGSDFDKALVCARRAGDRSLTLLAYEEAARLYTTSLEALDLARPGDERERCDLLLSLGEAEARAGNTPAAKEAFLLAADLARRLGLRRELARAAAGYGGRTVWSRAWGDARLVPLLEEGLAAVDDDDIELRARLLSRLVGALRDDPTRERRDRLSREAVELARAAGDPVALAYALDGRVAATLAPDTVAECLAVAEELREVGERIGDIERVANGSMDRFIVRVVLGEVSEAAADLAVMSHRAETLRQPVQLWHVSTARASLALAEGRLTDAEELIATAFAIGERPQPEMAIPVDVLQRFGLHDLRGALEELESELEDLAAAYPRRPVFRCALAYLYARSGALPKAKHTLEDLVRADVAALPFDMEWLLAMSLLAETAALLPDPASAAVLYRLLRPWGALNVSDHPEGIRGSVARYLGLLATTLSLWREAEEHFEYALRANERMGLRPWLARTQDDLARLLRVRGAEARAEELHSSALATYRELGMRRRRRPRG
jgi:tetratricopeptide (TPR) repeat protein